MTLETDIVTTWDIPATLLDLDGIPDRDEDPNLNGMVDAVETNPDNDNTDGDGTPDGAGLRTGTDPLDPSSDFIGTLSPGVGDLLKITWPSKPGALYRIETSPTLEPEAWDFVADDVPADPAQTETTLELLTSDDPARTTPNTLNRSARSVWRW